MPFTPETDTSRTAIIETAASSETTTTARASPEHTTHTDPDLEESAATATTATTTTSTPRPNNNNSNNNSNNYRPSFTMDNLFRFSLPHMPSSQAVRTAGVYVSGALFSLGFWFFIDASVYSKVNNPGDVHIKFVDWIPGICSALGMLVINSIEKSRLSSDSFSYSGSDVAWQARLVLFLGFALMAGGLAGSVAVLVLKYIVENYEFETMYFGVANVVANGLIMLSSIVLWVSQNMEDDYTYRLSL